MYSSFAYRLYSGKKDLRTENGPRDVSRRLTLQNHEAPVNDIEVRTDKV